MTTDPRLTDNGLLLVNSTDEIPKGMTDDQEDAFWQTHEYGPALLAQMRPAREVDPGLPPARPRSATITVRFEADILARLRQLAAHRGVAYQTLLKRFVVERLYDEERRQTTSGGDD
jgi:hypothetical protein